MEVVDWPSDDDVQELYNALRKIDPAFSTDVRSWSQLKKKMPKMYKFILKHCI